MILRWLRILWGGTWLRRSSRLRPLKAVMVEELPEHLDVNRVYVAGEGAHRWFVAMLCPCGCGETLHMNLLQESRPLWKLREHKNGTVTLRPSVWRRKGCHSHFFLRRGLIKWCQDD
jgi:hypothetical protein